MSRPRPSGEGKKGEGSRRRTRRACDRCRLKKAKCDGGTTCRTCKANNANCAYTARRGREARSYYCRMREVMEEAIQRLYWACRQGSGFPGDIPEESAGSLTTDTILRGLSLIDPADDGCATTIARTESDASPDRETDKDHFRRASAARVSARTDSTLSTESSIMPSPISHNGPRSNSSPSQQVSSATTIPAYDETICSQQQHLYESMPMLNYHANMGRLNTSVASSVAGYDENIESYLNVDAFQDPPRSVLPDASGAFTLSPKHHQVNVGANMLTLPQQQTASAPMCDGYLAPWPGSLAAAYQSVSAV